MLAELGIGATLYGVLSRGLLSASPIAAGDNRAHMPRFTGANAEANAKLVARLHELAKRWGITPSQLAIGWVLGKQPRLVPTLGMRTLAQLDEALAAKPLTPRNSPRSRPSRRAARSRARATPRRTCPRSTARSADTFATDAWRAECFAPRAKARQ